MPTPAFRAAFFTLALLAFAPPAWPHAFLAGASPPVGSELAASPPHLTLRFTEAVEPRFSTIDLLDATGARVKLGLPRLTAGDAPGLAVALPPLRPGTYTVVWHVTSVDTHKTEGRFEFTIRP